MVTPRRTTLCDEQIPPDLWVEFPRADLRLRLIEAVLVIAQSYGALSLDARDGDWWQKAWRAAHGSLETIEFLQVLTYSPQPQLLNATVP